MKKLLYILFLWSTVAGAQVINSATPPAGNPQTQTSTRVDANNNPIIYLGQYTGLYRYFYPLSVQSLGVFPFTVSSTPSVGDVITNTDDLLAAYHKSQPPIVTFTPTTTTLELTSAATGTATFNYTYAKQVGTNNFTELKIEGNGQTLFPGYASTGGSGSQSLTFPANVSTTYTFAATTQGGKFASANATVNYLPRRGSGRAAGPVPTDAEILAAAGGVTSLNSSRAGTFTVTGAGTNYPFVYYVSSAGALTSLKDANGLEALTSYNPTTRTILNGNGPGGGASVTIRVYTAQNATAGNTTMVTQ